MLMLHRTLRSMRRHLAPLTLQRPGDFLKMFLLRRRLRRGRHRNPFQDQRQIKASLLQAHRACPNAQGNLQVVTRRHLARPRALKGIDLKKRIQLQNLVIQCQLGRLLLNSRTQHHLQCVFVILVRTPDRGRIRKGMLKSRSQKWYEQSGRSLTQLAQCSIDIECRS